MPATVKAAGDASRLSARILLEDPVIRGIVVNARDVTERRRAEGALRETEERFRWTLEQAAENIFVVDLENKRILDANATLQRSLGYTLEELKGMTLYDFVAHDQESIDRNTDRIVAEGSAFVGERKYRHKDGSLIDVEVNAGAIPYGDGQAVCIVAHDITERKSTETALRQNLSVLLALARGRTGPAPPRSSQRRSLRGYWRSCAAWPASRRRSSPATTGKASCASGGLLASRTSDRESVTRGKPRARAGPCSRARSNSFSRLRRPGSRTSTSRVFACRSGAETARSAFVERYRKGVVGAQRDAGDRQQPDGPGRCRPLENASLYEALGYRERALQDLVEKWVGAGKKRGDASPTRCMTAWPRSPSPPTRTCRPSPGAILPSPNRAGGGLDTILMQVRSTVSDARRVIANLRPTALDDLGLAAAISLEVERLEGRGLSRQLRRTPR